MIHVRDLEVVKRWLRERNLGFLYHGEIPCPAVVMDPSQLGSCWGDWRLDHVRDNPMMGQKAPDDEDHLIALCAGHDERGARAGYQWNTASRDLERAYLAERRRERELLGEGREG